MNSHNHTLTDYTYKFILPVIIPAGIILAWFLTTTYGSLPMAILPSLDRVGTTFVEMIKSGQLQQDLGVSFTRIMKGYISAAFLGVLLGSLTGMFPAVRRAVIPFLTVLRQIPIMAWIPLLILWFGIGETSKVMIVVLASFFPILVNTEDGMESTPTSYVEVAQLYKLNPWQTFTGVYLPHALPHILVDLRLGLGVSWMAVVGAELIAATTGIGYRMSNARSLMQSNVVMVCMLVIGLVGILMDKAVSLIFGAITPWMKGKKS